MAYIFMEYARLLEGLGIHDVPSWVFGSLLLRQAGKGRIDEAEAEDKIR